MRGLRCTPVCVCVRTRMEGIRDETGRDDEGDDGTGYYCHPCS